MYIIVLGLNQRKKIVSYGSIITILSSLAIHVLFFSAVFLLIPTLISIEFGV